VTGTTNDTTNELQRHLRQATPAGFDYKGSGTLDQFLWFGVAGF